MSKSKKFVGLLVGMMLVLSSLLVGCGGGAPAVQPSSGSGAASPASSGTGTEAPQITTVAPGVITVGSDCDYPPFIQLEGDKPVGFEQEVMVALGNAMGYEIVYLPPQNFDSILASVAAGTKMDVGMSSFTINDERKQLVSFATPYFDSNQAVVALKTKGYTNAMDLNGMVVGAQSGTTGADWVRENLKDPGTVLKEYNQTSEALAAMMAGDIEAVFFDEPVAAELVKSTYTDAEIIESIATGEQYGIAVSKDNPALLAAINEALVTIKQNGEFDAIFAKYFPNLQPPSLGVK